MKYIYGMAVGMFGEPGKNCHCQIRHGLQSPIIRGFRSLSLILSLSVLFILLFSYRYIYWAFTLITLCHDKSKLFIFRKISHRYQFARSINDERNEKTTTVITKKPVVGKSQWFFNVSILHLCYLPCWLRIPIDIAFHIQTHSLTHTYTYPILWNVFRSIFLFSFCYVEYTTLNWAAESSNAVN